MRTAKEKAIDDYAKRLGNQLAAENRKRVKAAAPVMLAALVLSWERTADDGEIYYCNCPRQNALYNDCSYDPDHRHATGCQEARQAIRLALGLVTDRSELE